MNVEQTPSLKRPRSPTEPHPIPAAKIPRTATNHLQINYLVRQHKEDIPLVTVNDTLGEIARLLSEYDGVLQRHESLAGNLGARPVGPILIKRFEKMFDGPPKILKSHAKDSHVTWLDVAEFAQNNPKQFNLERTRNGIRVCQFYTKQCRVEISEEDYVLIASGHPQKLIPPQPIKEDEDKELGVMDLLDRNLGQVIQLADQVSGRARQMIHKMKGRRTAILTRREQEREPRRQPTRTEASPASPPEINGVNNSSSGRPVRSIEVSQSPPVGFTAVNLRQPAAEDLDRRPPLTNDAPRSIGDDAFGTPSNITIINGRSVKDTSPSERAELMKNFLTPSEREAGLTEETIRRTSLGSGTARTQAMHANAADKPRSRSHELPGGSSSTVAIPNTPASLMPQTKPAQSDRDDGGPFKAEMVRRMDNMWKGDRVIPPCDRCRRLHMDCLKNLTACMGCTKKHAKCSWKDVQAGELDMTAPPHRDRTPTPLASPPAPAPPLSAGSTIEVHQQPDELKQMSRIGRASLDLAGEKTEKPKDIDLAETREEAKSEPAPSNTSSGRFDVRPPPLVQQLQDAANGRVPTGSTPYETSFPPREKEKPYEEDDEGDRLQALAARVYRSASQGGHRA
ncbi:C6 finger domain protein [Cladophialophora carrionii]|uniref:C6 finger domain protein n=1 Tax=Cladophialophora carrionii TaxID=86049 RepID=A0A1C1CNK0_9EURO|nr:C6 finger domain protein [Cladophialophora carrionii]